MDGDSKKRSAEPAAPVSAIDPVDRFIARLYRSGLSVSGDFRQWALQELAHVVPHDGALWGSGIFAERRFHSYTLTNLPPSFPATLEATTQVNPLIPAIVGNLDCPVDSRLVVPDRQFFNSEIYKQAFAPHGIARILATAHLDRRSGLYSMVSIYRRDRANIFSEAEKAQQKHIVFHMFNAASHAFFLRLVRERGRPAGSAAAVVDRMGCFHQVQPQFLDLLEAHFPPKNPPVLPFPLPAVGETEHIGPLCARAEPSADMFLVYLWKAGPLDKLTQREREIVFAVAQGLSFKQAAKKIGLAPSTVANHLYRVYRKLGVYSRTELAQLVHPQSES
ncbi:MAG TPA: helix-turn-helix transcriptional regulator [Nevskiaceae bacterium]|nr:helix-turn-helix transcriptional regulator [Nevskiaceae bacterium]